MPREFIGKITKKKKVSFSVDKFGLYVIIITARCRVAKQDDVDKNEALRVEIDGLKLREIPPLDKPQYNKIPPAWNGTDQRGLMKIVVFILTLNKGDHVLNFFPLNGAIVDDWDFYLIENSEKISFRLEKQAENGDKRPWYTFVLINVPLLSLEAEASVSWHFWDGDDIKLIADNVIQENITSKLWKNWLWSARPWQLLSGIKKEQKNIKLGFQQGVHYLEFWSDKTPTLHYVNLDLNGFQPKRIPTLNDPEWTGNFADDPDQMIMARALFGEARNTLMPDDVRFAIGWVIKNRVASERWPNTYWEVITQHLQFSAFNLVDPNRAYVENPLFTEREIDKTAWRNAYQIAGKLINNETPDPTKGANHYYDDSINVPSWAENNQSVYSVTYVNRYGRKTTIFFYNL